MSRVKVKGRVTDGVGDFRVRMTRYQDVFEQAAGERLFPGTLNVDIGTPLSVREDFRIRGTDIGEPGQDLIVERCIVAGHRAYRIRPFQLKGGGGAMVTTSLKSQALSSYDPCLRHKATP